MVNPTSDVSTQPRYTIMTRSPSKSTTSCFASLPRAGFTHKEGGEETAVWPGFTIDFVEEGGKERAETHEAILYDANDSRASALAKHHLSLLTYTKVGQYFLDDTDTGSISRLKKAVSSWGDMFNSHSAGRYPDKRPLQGYLRHAYSDKDRPTWNDISFGDTTVLIIGEEVGECDGYHSVQGRIFHLNNDANNGKWISRELSRPPTTEANDVMNIPEDPDRTFGFADIKRMAEHSLIAGTKIARCSLREPPSIM